ncbi:hypothetical protein D3C81_924030 [compost metagenome]
MKQDVRRLLQTFEGAVNPHPVEGAALEEYEGFPPDVTDGYTFGRGKRVILIDVKSDGVIIEGIGLKGRAHLLARESQVDFLGHQLRRKDVRRAGCHFEVDQREALMQEHKQMRHQVIGHRYGAADPKLLGGTRLGVKMMFPLLICLEDLLGVRKELFAFVRQLNLFPQAIEQPGIQLPFERLNSRGYRRLRKKQHLRSFVEATVMINVNKRLDMIDVQKDPSLCSYISNYTNLYRWFY